MVFRRLAPYASTLILGLLAVLLAVSAILIHWWIRRASEADRLERALSLETAMSGFRGEFSESVTDVLRSFRPAPQKPEVDWESYVGELYAQWDDSPYHRQRLLALSVMEATTETDALRLRLDPSNPAHRFERQSIPKSLEWFRKELLDTRNDPRKPATIPPNESLLVEIDGHPAVALPLTIFPPEHDGPAGDSTSAPGRFRPPRLDAWCFLELDPTYFQRHVFPDSAKRLFRGPELSGFELAVMSPSLNRAVFQTDPGFSPSDFSEADAVLPLFRAAPRRAEGGDPPPPPPGRESPKPPPKDDRPPRRGPPPRPHGPPNRTGPEGQDGWLLVAQHRSGSIERIVGQARRRNLALGYGVLALVFASIAALTFTARRAQALARQQMEFVAGVSHELRTPLAVIQSAGFNLANGRVQDPSRVRHYGTVIQNEGLRLSSMVEQMLGWAGIQSGRQIHDFQSLDVGDLVARVVADRETAFKDAGWKVETEIEKGLPLVSGDARALESVVGNLLQNALKYADDGKRLRVSVASAHHSRKPEISIVVADGGPGIDARDLPYIFDPFFRGSRTASALPGAGLGLSLLKRHVEAHRGRVTVESTPDGGTTFTVFLPATDQSGTASRQEVVWNAEPRTPNPEP